jgi:hypothetical protein
MSNINKTVEVYVLKAPFRISYDICRSDYDVLLADFFTRYAESFSIIKMWLISVLIE